jgi:SAM-dependent methyltransferase
MEKNKMFDSQSNDFEDIYYDNDIHIIESNNLADFFRENSVYTIFDVGCGTGLHSKELTRNGFIVDMLDLSPKMLEEAKRRNPNLVAIQADISEYKSGKKFDAIISIFATISYIINDDKIISAFRNIYDSLKEGGWFLFDVINGIKALSFFEKVIYEDIPKGVNIWEREIDSTLSLMKGKGFFILNGKKTSDSHVWRYYTPAELKLFLKAIGFTRVNIYGGYDRSPFKEEQRRLFVFAQK